MKILASEKLSEHKFKDNNGYLICTDCILSRTGKQTYKKDEVFKDGSDEKIEVNRTEDEVFSTKSLASFENCPVCINHPDCDVNPENHNELSVGFVRNVRKGEYEGQPVMIADLVITDAKAIDLVESGEMTELSCGYDCDITDENNPQQINIRGNHVALCEQGRAGIARIVDSVDDLGLNDSNTTDVVKIIKGMNKGFTLITQRSKKIKPFPEKKYEVIQSYLLFGSNQISENEVQEVNKRIEYLLERKLGLMNDIRATKYTGNYVDFYLKRSYTKRYAYELEVIVYDNINSNENNKNDFESLKKKLKNLLTPEEYKTLIKLCKNLKDSVEDADRYLFEISYLDKRSDRTESAFIEATNKNEAEMNFKKQFKGKYDKIFNISMYKKINDSIEDNVLDFKSLKERLQKAKNRQELRTVLAEVEAHKDNKLLTPSEYNELIKFANSLHDSIQRNKIMNIISAIRGVN